MNFTGWVFTVGFVVSTGGFIFTLFKFLHEQRGNRAERIKRESVEKELLENKQRADAPYLVASLLWAEDHHSGEPAIRAGSGITILSDTRLHFNPGERFPSENLPVSGAKVYLMVKNQGKQVRAARIADSVMSLDARDGEIAVDGTNQKRSRVIYNFDISKLGEAQRFVLHFESLDGFKQSHVYETRHGFCELRRVDPD